MLGQSDVGSRVVVRRVVGRRNGRPLMTDVLGILTSITDTELTVATDAGVLAIARPTVVAAKRVPQKPQRRAAGPGTGDRQ